MHRMDYSKGKRGQLLTTDFILSLAIFLAILLTAMGLWNSVDTQIRDAENRRDMQAISTYVSDTLVRNPGVPQNWTNNTVQVIGLAKDEHDIDMDKVLAFKHMDYDRASFILRLRNYNFYVWITDSNGYDLTSGVVRSPVALIIHRKSGTDYAKMLNNTVIEWDLYWDDNNGAGGGDDLTASFINDQHFTSVNSYPSSGINSVITSFDKLMNNQSSYRTIIIEDIGLNNDTTANVSGLINFTSRGGILVYTDGLASPINPLIGGKLGMSFGVCGVLAPSTKVNYTNPLLLNASTNDEILFSTRTRGAYSNPAWNDNELHVLAKSSIPTLCQVCWWDYEFGRVYYIEDTNGTINFVSGGSDQLMPHLNVVGENLTIGKRQTSQTTDLISIRRMAILSGFNREVANLYMSVWR
jgi:hypothetical protein